MESKKLSYYKSKTGKYIRIITSRKDVELRRYILIKVLDFLFVGRLMEIS